MTSNPIYCFFATGKNPAPLLLRLWIAFGFFQDGGSRLFGWFDPLATQWGTWINALPFPAPTLMGLAIVEMVIGILLFFGFFTRLAALGVLAIMLVAAGVIYWHQGAAGTQLPITFALIGMALLFLGGGPLSLDRAISRQLLPQIG